MNLFMIQRGGNEMKEKLRFEYKSHIIVVGREFDNGDSYYWDNETHLTIDNVPYLIMCHIL